MIQPAFDAQIFGTLHPFFEHGTINGRVLANAGFMTALLRRDPFAAYHFFVARPEALAEELEGLNLPAVRRGAVLCLHRTALPHRLRQEPYGLFHFSDPVSEFVPLCQARNAWAPEIFPVTAVNHTISYSQYNSAFLQHLWGGVSPRDAIGCNSTAAREVLRQYFAHLRHGQPPSAKEPALHVLPMGVDPSLLPQRDSAARRRLRDKFQIPDSCVVFLLFGRIALADKLDPQPLLLALRRAMALCPPSQQSSPALDMRLILAGFMQQGDKALDYLQAVARMLGISLTLMPNPTDAEKHALYAAADVFVSPSDNIQETFGLSLLEAGAAELPVIASDWDGYRDILVPGHTGISVPTLAPAQSPDMDLLAPLLFDNQHHLLRSQQSVVDVPALAEALYSLAADPAARQSMGRAGRAHVLGHFCWDRVLDQWLHLWGTLQATALPPATEQALRRARHPASLPVGRIFAPYASATLQPEMRVQCTALGEALRKGLFPFSACTTLGEVVQESLLRALLVWARQPCSLRHLAARWPTLASTRAPELASSRAPELTFRPSPELAPELSPTLAHDLSPESLNFYVLWALKHDLLERQATTPPSK